MVYCAVAIVVIVSQLVLTVFRASRKVVLLLLERLLLVYYMWQQRRRNLKLPLLLNLVIDLPLALDFSSFSAALLSMTIVGQQKISVHCLKFVSYREACHVFGHCYICGVTSMTDPIRVICFVASQNSTHAGLVWNFPTTTITP